MDKLLKTIRNNDVTTLDQARRSILSRVNTLIVLMNAAEEDGDVSIKYSGGGGG